MATQTDPAPAAATETLAERAAEGDVDAFSSLYLRYSVETYQFCLRRVGYDPVTADDVNADLWLRVMRSIPGYVTQGEGHFAGWLFTIAKNHCHDHHRAWGRRRREVLTADEVILDSPTTGESPEACAERHELASILARVVNRLSDDERQCLIYRIYFGLSVSETAKILCKTPSAITTLQYRATRRLRGLMPSSMGGPRYDLNLTGVQAADRSPA